MFKGTLTLTAAFLTWDWNAIYQRPCSLLQELFLFTTFDSLDHYHLWQGLHPIYSWSWLIGAALITWCEVSWLRGCPTTYCLYGLVCKGGRSPLAFHGIWTKIQRKLIPRSSPLSAEFPDPGLEHDLSLQLTLHRFLGWLTGGFLCLSRVCPHELFPGYP